MEYQKGKEESREKEEDEERRKGVCESGEMLLRVDMKGRDAGVGTRGRDESGVRDAGSVEGRREERKKAEKRKKKED